MEFPAAPSARTSVGRVGGATSSTPSTRRRAEAIDVTGWYTDLTSRRARRRRNLRNPDARPADPCLFSASPRASLRAGSSMWSRTSCKKLRHDRAASASWSGQAACHQVEEQLLRSTPPSAAPGRRIVRQRSPGPGSSRLRPLAKSIRLRFSWYAFVFCAPGSTRTIPRQTRFASFWSAPLKAKSLSRCSAPCAPERCRSRGAGSRRRSTRR